jgi:hypothetical protein
MHRVVSRICDGLFLQKGGEMNNRQRLALHLLDWHGGQDSGLYALGSSWLNNHPVESSVIRQACEELTKISEKQVKFPETISKSDIREVLLLKVKVLRMTTQGESVK